MADDIDKLTVPVSDDPNVRKEVTKHIIRRCTTKSDRVLDIGGNEYSDLCEDLGVQYTTLNLIEPQKTGKGGYHKADILYDGRVIPNMEDQEFIILNFVLHHAVNPISLIQQAKQLRPKYLLIGEDLSDITYPRKWHERNYQHQPGGTFRSNEEWLALFRLLDLTVVKYLPILRPSDLDPSLVFRCMYLLRT